MKKFFTLFSLLALISITPACKQKSATSNRKKIAVVSNAVASFWDIAKTGMNQAGKDFDIDVTMILPSSVADQKEKIDDLLIKGVDGISISAIDPENQTEMLNRVAASTKLITMDSDAPLSNRLCYIGLDNYSAGRMAGKMIKEAIPQGGKIAVFVGRIETENASRRRQGVIDELLDRSIDAKRFDPINAEIKNETYQIIGTYLDNCDVARAKEIATDTITRVPALNCMVGLYSYNTPAIIEALNRAGKTNQIQVVGFDEDQTTLQAIEQGTVYATIVQNPYEYGYQSIAVLRKILAGESAAYPASKFIDIPARAIKKDTVKTFQADLKAKLAQ